MKIPIKKYVMNEKLSWEERYKELEEHYTLETVFMSGVIAGQEVRIKDLEDRIESLESDVLVLEDELETARTGYSSYERH